LDKKIVFKILIKEFYKNVWTKESTVKYLQGYGLSCAKQYHKCGDEVKLYQRNDQRKVKKVFQCSLKNSRLSLIEIIEIMYFWVTDNQVVQILKFKGKSKNTICD